jgi:hypothetical protein
MSEVTDTDVGQIWFSSVPYQHSITYNSNPDPQSSYEILTTGRPNKIYTHLSNISDI